MRQKEKEIARQVAENLESNLQHCPNCKTFPFSLDVVHLYKLVCKHCKMAIVIYVRTDEETVFDKQRGKDKVQPRDESPDRKEAFKLRTREPIEEKVRDKIRERRQ